jgi:hypothetical protein
MNVSLIDGSNLSAVDEFSRRAAVGNPWRAAQREGHMTATNSRIGDTPYLLVELA